MIRRRWLAVAIEKNPCPVHNVCHETIVARFYRRDMALEAIDQNEIKRRRELLAGDDFCATFTWQLRDLRTFTDK